MKTLEEIHKIRKEKREELDLRVNTKADVREKHILVCHGTGCTSSKSPEILENFRKILKEKNIENVRVIKTGCFGLCAKGPIVIIRPEDTFYANVTPEDCNEIIESHIVEGKIVERLLCKDIDGTKVKQGATISCVGAYQHHMQEMDPAILPRASKIYFDSRDAVLSESGDILIPLEQGIITEDDFTGDLGDVLLGKVVGRENDNEIIVFETVGVAAQDLVAAKEIYDKAVEAGVGIQWG